MTAEVGPSARRPRAPSLALVAARVAYAFNWYNVGAVLPLVKTGLAASTAELGVVLGAFLVGVGLFQLPAGFASLRWGARTVSLIGLGVLSTASLASALSPTWTVLAVLRFAGGVGAALFFSPALSLIASYYPPGRRGAIVGLFNAGFNLGGGLGLLVGAFLGVWFGWRIALLAGGAALGLISLVTWRVLPPELPRSERAGPAALREAGRRVLGSRSVWALALALAGFWATVYVSAQYLVVWVADVHPGWGIAFAASLATAVVFIAFPGGPVGGWLAERRRRRRGLLALFAGLTGVLALAVPLTGPVTAWLVLLPLGFFDGVVFAIQYLIPTYLPDTRREGLALGVALINSVQVSLGSGLAVLFGVVAATAGYSWAWVLTGALALALLPLLWLVDEGASARPAEPPSVPAAAAR